MKKVLIFFIIMVSLLSGCEKNNVKTDAPSSNKASKEVINQDSNKNIPPNKSNLTVVNCQIMFLNGGYGMRGYKVDLSNGINPHLFFCKKNMIDCKNGLNLTKLSLPEKPDNNQSGSLPPYETDACFTIEK
jgi:hypothetical protein